MKWADKVDMKLSSPVTSKRLRQLLDDKRLVVVAAAGRPVGAQRLLVADEVDVYPAPDHQRPAITTRG